MVEWTIVLVASSSRGLTVGLLTTVTAVAFEGMAVVTAMPAAAADLGDLHLYAWAFTTVMIAQLIAIVVAGRLADTIGPVRPLLAGLVVFALGITIAALAPTMPILLAGRFIQGLGAGAVSLTLMVVTAVAYGPAERARIMTWYSACWMMPSFVGPAIAAWVTETWSWHWVFWLVLPFVVLGWALMAPGLAHLSSLPEPEEASTPVPIPAAVAVAAGITAIQIAGQHLDVASLAWLGGGLVLLLLSFARLMPHGYTPIAPGLASVVNTRLLVSGAFFGTQSFLPLMLTERGVGLQASGWVITVGSVGWMGGSWLQARPWLPWSRDQIIIVGAVNVAIGTAIVAGGAWWGGADLVAPIAGSILAGLGMGLQSSSTNLATMQLSPSGELGRNTSSLQVGETMGNALFTGAAGTIFAALSIRSSSAVTFGWVASLLTAVALAGVVTARAIGHVDNHSRRPTPRRDPLAG